MGKAKDFLELIKNPYKGKVDTNPKRVKKTSHKHPHKHSHLHPHVHAHKGHVVKKIATKIKPKIPWQ